jgi:hypothetical protein
MYLETIGEVPGASTTDVFCNFYSHAQVPDPRKSFPTNNAKIVLVIY